MHPESSASFLELGSRSRPALLSEPLPVGNDCPYPAYSALEHEIWNRCFTRHITGLQQTARVDVRDVCGVRNVIRFDRRTAFAASVVDGGDSQLLRAVRCDHDLSRFDLNTDNVSFDGHSA